MKKHLCLSSTALFGTMLAVAGPAHAQDATPVGNAPPAQTTSVADDSAASAVTDIIVTARRVDERLQDVPISITVFNQEQLNNRNVAVASDLATYTPSLSVNTRYGPEKAAFAIRGFTQDASTGPTVGVYFADVIAPRAQGGTTSGNSAGAGAFTDLQNVQVLKGPQGTLFGRNTTGGAILLVPRRPGYDLSGYVEGTVGNYDQRRVQAAINIPLADTFKVRLAVDRNERDGYIINRSGVGPDAFNDVGYTYYRLGILADLTPDLENYTVAYYSNSDTNGYASRVVACDQDRRANQLAVNGPFPNGRPNTDLALVGAACDQVARQAARGDSLTDVEVYQPDQSAGVHLDQWQVINTTTWQASDELTVKNIISYGEFRERSGFNLNSDNFFLPAEFGPLAGQRFQYINLDIQPGYDAAAQSTFTEELQLQGGAFDGRLNYVVGSYLEFARPLSFNQQRTGIFGNCANAGTLDCTGPLGFVSISQSRTQFDFDNHGVFGQGTFAFTDQLSLTLGGRWTFDKTVGLTQSSRQTLVGAGPGGAFIPISQQCTDSFRRLNPDGTVIDALRDPRGLAACETVIEEKSNEPTWNVGVDFQPTSDTLFYGKWSRGYRQGGINFTAVGLETYSPEKVDLYEIGAKLTSRGALNGYLNIAAFYNDFSDQQIFAQTTTRPELVGQVVGAAVIVNAGKSVLKGIEVDASVNPFESLRIDAGYTYLDTEVKEIATPAELLARTVGTPYLSLTPVVNEGDPLTFSPKHRLALTATYTLPLDESLGDVSIGGTYLYSAEQFAVNLQSSPLGLLPETNTFNLNFNWDNIAGSPIDFAAFATNITNEIYPVSVSQGYYSSGYESVQVGQPRIYGARLRYRFGE